MDPCLGCLVCSSHINARKARGISQIDFETYLKQLFKYLLIPKSHAAELRSLCTKKTFCTPCLQTAKEIADLQRKVTALEMQIQYRVESMGKAVVAVTSELEENCVDGITEMWSDATQKLWLKFRYPVIQNFAKGFLPTPSVVMKQCPVSAQLLQQLKHSESTTETLQKATCKNNECESNVDFENTRKENSVPENKASKSDLVKTISSIRKRKKALESDTIESISCPVCPFKLDFSSQKNRIDCRRKLGSHYMKEHNPVRITDVQVDSEGREYYKCPSCPFRKSVRPIAEGETRSLACVRYTKRYDAMVVHSRHHLILHSTAMNVRNRGLDPQSLNPSTTKQKQARGKKQIPEAKVSMLVQGGGIR